MATFRSTAQISRRTLFRSARGGPAVRTRIPRSKAAGHGVRDEGLRHDGILEALVAGVGHDTHDLEDGVRYRSGAEGGEHLELDRAADGVVVTEVAPGQRLVDHGHLAARPRRPARTASGRGAVSAPASRNSLPSRGRRAPPTARRGSGPGLPPRCGCRRRAGGARDGRRTPLRAAPATRARTWSKNCRLARPRRVLARAAGAAARGGRGRGRSPGPAVWRFTKLRIRRAAPASRTRDSATSATTRTPLSRRPRNPPPPPLPESLSGSTRSRRAARSAGTRPQSERGQHRDAEAEEQDGQVQADDRLARDEAFGDGAHEGLDAEVGEEAAEGRAQEREEQALDQQLADEARPAWPRARPGPPSPAPARSRGRAACWPRCCTRSAAAGPRPPRGCRGWSRNCPMMLSTQVTTLTVNFSGYSLG